MLSGKFYSHFIHVYFLCSKKILLEVHEVQKQADWIEKRYHIIYHGAVSEDS
jgi:hypothetical protein